MREDYEKTVERNRAHLPSAEPPALSPDLIAVEKFIIETRFSFWVEGDGFAYNGGDLSYERRHIAKPEFEGDTLRFIELLNDDVDWFYSHPLGAAVSEEARFLEDFLDKKYPMLSEKSRSRIVGTYCENQR